MNDSPVNRSLPAAAETWKQRYEALRLLVATGSRMRGAEPLGLVRAGKPTCSACG